MVTPHTWHTAQLESLVFIFWFLFLFFLSLFVFCLHLVYNYLVRIQYVQLKNVLLHEFGDIMNKILVSNPKTRFALALPIVNINTTPRMMMSMQPSLSNSISHDFCNSNSDLFNSSKDNSNSKMKDKIALKSNSISKRNIRTFSGSDESIANINFYSIPLSVIAKRLAVKLECLTSDCVCDHDDNDNDNHNQGDESKTDKQIISEQNGTQIKLVDLDESQSRGRTQSIVIVDSNSPKKEKSKSNGIVFDGGGICNNSCVIPLEKGDKVKNKGNGSVEDEIKNELSRGREIDIISIKIGNRLIESFEEIYKKYISNSSEYTVNIKSQTRYTLTNMYDKQIYRIWKLKYPYDQVDIHIHYNNNNNSNNEAKSTSRSHSRKHSQSTSITIWDRLKYDSIIAGHHSHSHNHNNGASSNSNKQDNKLDKHNHNSNSNYNSNGGNLNEMNNRNFNNDEFNMIRAQFGAYARLNIHSRELCQNGLIGWLLIRLIETMEEAVKEISLLMNDSYSRFRRDKILYSKVVQLADKHREKLRQQLKKQHSQKRSLTDVLANKK